MKIIIYFYVIEEIYNMKLSVRKVKEFSLKYVGLIEISAKGY